jgi:hypothetical protein
MFLAIGFNLVGSTVADSCNLEELSVIRLIQIDTVSSRRALVQDQRPSAPSRHGP